MVVVIDNYDSFTYNLVQLIGELGVSVRVFRNDEITIEEIQRMKPKRIVISSGPRTESHSGIALKLIQAVKGQIPILGVSSGHLLIAEAFGAQVTHAQRLMHGKTSLIHHDGKTIFQRLPVPFKGTRYHSLILDERSLPNELHVSATSETGEIMGIRHNQFPIEGVQFHPESIMTEYGRELLNNFIHRKEAIER